MKLAIRDAVMCWQRVSIQTLLFSDNSTEIEFAVSRFCSDSDVGMGNRVRAGHRPNMAS
jgi:hypothetical protein